MVYTNENNLLVSNAKNMLLNNGLEVFVKNEHVSTGAHVHIAFMELWVNQDADYSKAKELLSALESNEDLDDWLCTNCNEINDASFEVCWKCRSDSSLF